jgi:hypothetical protein
MAGKLEHGYDKDFYAWTLYNAELIRQGKFTEVDIEHVAEEIESMGKRERRELVNRLAILMAHLLKWQFQPGKQSDSWKYTIKEQRIALTDLLDESPSLKHELKIKHEHAYEQAILIAARETGLEEKIFPKQCSFTCKQCLALDFLPGQD